MKLSMHLSHVYRKQSEKEKKVNSAKKIWSKEASKQQSVSGRFPDRDCSC